MFAKLDLYESKVENRSPSSQERIRYRKSKTGFFGKNVFFFGDINTSHSLSIYYIRAIVMFQISAYYMVAELYQWIICLMETLRIISLLVSVDDICYVDRKTIRFYTGHIRHSLNEPITLLSVEIYKIILKLFFRKLDWSTSLTVMTLSSINGIMSLFSILVTYTTHFYCYPYWKSSIDVWFLIW